MELSEAKEILKDIVENGYYISPMEHPQETARAGIEAIDTVLKALEEFEKQLDLDYVDKNYINKEYHDMAIKEQNDIINDLKSKIDNSISKDEYDIYPLTIIKDRYCGTYSGGKYTAWNLDCEDIPQEINYDDVSCQIFWRDNKIPVGKGKTPVEAIHNLQELLGEE